MPPLPLRVWGPVCVLAWAALLRVAAFTGPSHWDDFAYLEFARDWIDGRFDPSRLGYVYGVRYGLILPVAGSMALFGTAPWAVALPGFIASMLGVWCGMRVGKHVGGPTVGVLVGLVLATTPLTARYATKILPEAYMDLALWAMLAVGLEGRARGSRALFFLAGLLGGYAYLVRSYGLALAVLGIVPILWPGRRRPWPLLPFAASLAALPIAEFIYHGLATGDPLWTLHVQARVYASLGNLATSLLIYPKALLLPGAVPAFGVVPHLALLGIALCWRNASPCWTLGLTLLVLWFGFMQFGIMSWRPMVLIHKEPRYLSVLVLPFALIAADMVSRMAAPRARTWRMALWPVVVLACAWAMVEVIRLPIVAARERSGLREFRLIADAIGRDRPPGVAFPHWRWRLRINYLTGYAAPYWCGSGARAGCPLRVPDAHDAPRAGEWVVVDRARNRSWPPGSGTLPEWMTAPPSGWTARVNADSALVVEVPAGPPRAAPKEDTR